MCFNDYYDEIIKELLQDECYGFLTGKILNSSQSMTFLTDKYKDIYSWREEARSFIKDRLHYSPEVAPFNESVEEEVDFGDYIRQKIYFFSAPHCRIPAYLLIPKNLKKPAPAVITLHDHGGLAYWGKEKSVEHKSWNPYLKRHIDVFYKGRPVASELARIGYVVLVIDSLFFGERKYKASLKDELDTRLKKFEFESEGYINEFDAIAWEVEPELVKAIYYAGCTFMGIQTWDDMASVGFLCSRPEVDPDRIGCIGLSMGGFRSAWLSAMDDRVKCSVVVGWMARYREMIQHRLLRIAWMWAVPGLYDSLDYPDIVSIAAPKPLMVMHGNQDWLFPHETGEKAIEIVKNVYKKAGFENSFVYKIYNQEHVFNTEMQETAYSWLNSHLR